MAQANVLNWQSDSTPTPIPASVLVVILRDLETIENALRRHVGKPSMSELVAEFNKREQAGTNWDKAHPVRNEAWLNAMGGESARHLHGLTKRPLLARLWRDALVVGRPATAQGTEVVAELNSQQVDFRNPLVGHLLKLHDTFEAAASDVAARKNALHYEQCLIRMQNAATESYFQQALAGLDPRSPELVPLIGDALIAAEVHNCDSADQLATAISGSVHGSTEWSAWIAAAFRTSAYLPSSSLPIKHYLGLSEDAQFPATLAEMMDTALSKESALPPYLKPFARGVSIRSRVVIPMPQREVNILKSKFTSLAFQLQDLSRLNPDHERSIWMLANPTVVQVLNQHGSPSAASNALFELARAIPADQSDVRLFAAASDTAIRPALAGIDFRGPDNYSVAFALEQMETKNPRATSYEYFRWVIDSVGLVSAEGPERNETLVEHLQADPYNYGVDRADGPNRAPVLPRQISPPGLDLAPPF